MKCKSSAAFTSVSITALAIAVMYIFAFTATTKAQEIRVQGKVVDDQTGKPITQMMIQAGRIDPKDPKKITWGYSERRTSSKTGRFTTTIRWSEGWTARVVVDGYRPHPILSKAPAEGVTELNVVLRLKRGPTIRGRIVDHKGKPVAKANVFAISPRRLNLYQGQAHDRYMNRIDSRAKSVATDKDGRFQLPSGGSTYLAISTKSLDAWTAKINPGSKDELEIQLPAPTKLTITVDIQGADKETEVFYQLLTHLMEGFDKIESTRSFKVKNGQSMELTSLPPGKYQFCRMRNHRFDNVGYGAMIDRTFLELKSGEAKELRFVRKTGKRIQGVVQWPEGEELAGVMLKVQSAEPIQAPWSKHKYTTTYDSRLIAGKPQVKVIEANRIPFSTEVLAAGKYQVQVTAYSPMTPEEMRSTGIRAPKYTASKLVRVSEKSGPNMLVIKLESNKRSNQTKK